MKVSNLHSLERFRSSNNSFVRFCLGVTILSLISASCSDFIDTGVEKSKDELFDDKARRIANQYQNSEELFTQLVRDIYDAYTNDLERVRERLDQLQEYTVNLEYRMSPISSESRNDNNRINFDAEMLKLASYDHIGNDFFFKLRALTMLIEKEHPYLDRSDTKQMNSVIQKLVNGYISKIAQEPEMTDAQVCVLRAAEDANIQAEGAFALATGALVGCLWSGWGFAGCLATVVFTFGATYYTIFNQLDTSIARCLMDYPIYTP